MLEAVSHTAVDCSGSIHPVEAAEHVGGTSEALAAAHLLPAFSTPSQ
jgi:hypothetical protein